MDEERGPAKHPRDLTGEVARDRVGLQGRPPRDPVHGAYGYSAEYGIERYFRNARAPIIYEGTTQIHKMMQAEHALGFRNLYGRDGDVSPIAAWAPARVHRASGPVPTGA